MSRRRIGDQDAIGLILIANAPGNGGAGRKCGERQE